MSHWACNSTRRSKQGRMSFMHWHRRHYTLKINNFQGYLPDISAETKPLMATWLAPFSFLARRQRLLIEREFFFSFFSTHWLYLHMFWHVLAFHYMFFPSLRWFETSVRHLFWVELIAQAWKEIWLRCRDQLLICVHQNVWDWSRNHSERTRTWRRFVALKISHG